MTPPPSGVSIGCQHEAPTESDQPMPTTAKETADLALEILKDLPEQHLVQEAIQLVNRCRTTTLALKALQQAIRETCGDDDGAALLEAAISAMAVHDAETM